MSRRLSTMLVVITPLRYTRAAAISTGRDEKTDDGAANPTTFCLIPRKRCFGRSVAVQFPGVGKPGTCACIALSPIISLADYCNWTIWLRKELRNRIICMIDCNGQPVILLSIPLPRSYDFLVSSCSKKKGFAFR